jgi:hypothetical protein
MKDMVKTLSKISKMGRLPSRTREGKTGSLSKEICDDDFDTELDIQLGKFLKNSNVA